MTKRPRLTASALNDRLFLAFPIGWMVGILVGTIYSVIFWQSIQVEVGRALLVAVTASQLMTLLMVTLTIKRALRAHG